MKSLAGQIRQATLAVIALSALGAVSVAQAAGTAVDTTISNQATVNYSVGSVSQTAVSSNTTTFKVDKKVDVLVTPIAAATTVPGTNNVAVTFDVKNEGNSADSFTFTQALASGITLNTVRIYQDNPSSGTVGSWDAGDTLITAGSTVVAFTNELVDAVNATKRFFIVSNIPASATNGQTAVYTLTATTTSVQNNTVADDPNNTAGADVVFAEGSGPAYDGAIGANETYTISTAALSVNKASAVVSDGIGGVAPNAKAIPGATVEYTIVVSNGGAQAASAVNLSDAIPTNTSYVLNSLTYQVGAGAATTQTDAADADVGAYIATGTPRVVIGNVPVDNSGAPAISVAANSSVTVKFRVTIN